MKTLFYPNIKDSQDIKGWVSKDLEKVNLKVGESVELEDVTARAFKTTFPFIIDFKKEQLEESAKEYIKEEKETVIKNKEKKKK